MAQNASANANVNVTTNTAQAQAQIEALEGSIKVLDGAVNLVGGTLETVAGGLALTGALSKEQAEQFESAAIGAIAFADGAKRTLDGVVNLQEGFTKLAAGSKAAAVASRVLGTAIKVATGPIGIAVVAIGAIITILVKFKDSLGIVGDAIDFVTNGINKLTDAIGLTDTAAAKEIETNKKLAESQANKLELLKAEGADRETLVKKERELLKTRVKAEKEGSDEQKKAIQDLALFNAKVRGENAKADADAQKKRLDEAKKANDLYKDQLQKFADEEVNLLAKTDEEKLKIEFDRTIREINDLELSEARKAELRLQAEENYQIKVGQLKEEKLKEQAEKEAALQLQLDQAAQDKANQDIVNFSAQLDEIYNLQLTDQQRSLNAVQDKYSQLEEFYKDDAEALKAIAEQKENDITAIEEAGAAARRQIIGGTIDNFQGALTALFGESKAVASANVLIDAAQAAVGIIKNSQGTGPLAIAYQISQFALLAATTVASLRQINSAEPGSSGGGGFTAPKPTPVTGGASIFTGALPGTGGTPTTGVPTQGSPTGGGRAEPIRAYVIAQDVTTGQEADAAINRRRRLGPG
jgi:hypothetical protein